MNKSTRVKKHFKTESPNKAGAKIAKSLARAKELATINKVPLH